MTDDVEMPKRIWAKPAAFGDSKPLCGEWNYCDTHSPDDTVYVHEDLVNGLATALADIAKTKYGLQGIQEDHSDVNAYNYHAMEYWANLALQYERIARVALRTLKDEIHEN